MSVHSTLDIQLLGKEYRVACTPDERDSLLAAVAFLDAKMTEIGAKTRSTGERLAVMVALNIAHEFLARNLPAATGLAGPNAAFDGDEFARRIGAIEARIDAVLAPQEQLF